MKRNGGLPGMSMTIHFDQQRETESGDYDYSPLRRVTCRSFLMGILVSMGGLM